MKNIGDFTPFIALYAPGIPDEYIQHVVRETIADFMRYTRVADDEIQFRSQKGMRDYVLDLPKGRHLVSVKAVCYTKDKACRSSTWQQLVNTPAFRAYEVFDDYDGFPTIVFANEVPNGNIIKVTYTWTIDRDDCEVPEFLYHKYMDIIVAGSLERLYKIPNVEWANVQLAMQYGNEYRSGLQHTRVKRIGGRKMLGSVFKRRRFL